MIFYDQSQMFLTLIQQTTLGFKLKTLLLYLTLDNFFLFVGHFFFDFGHFFWTLDIFFLLWTFFRPCWTKYFFLFLSYLVFNYIYKKVSIKNRQNDTFLGVFFSKLFFMMDKKKWAWKKKSKMSIKKLFK